MCGFSETKFSGPSGAIFVKDATFSGSRQSITAFFLIRLMWIYKCKLIWFQDVTADQCSSTVQSGFIAVVTQTPK